MKVTEEEKNYIKQNYNKIRVKEIASVLKTDEQRVRNIAYQLGLRSQLGKEIRDKTLKNIPEEFEIKRIVKTKSGRFHVEVSCPFCSSIFTTAPHKLKSGHTKSCGCTALGHRKGLRYVSGTFYDRIVRGAKSRNHKVIVTIEQLEALLIKQDFKCALSGLPIKVDYSHLNLITGSVDRIDSNKDYTIDNVQWVHKDINWMKQDFDQWIFIEYCKMIAEKHE